VTGLLRGCARSWVAWSSPSPSPILAQRETAVSGFWFLGFVPTPGGFSNKSSLSLVSVPLHTTHRLRRSLSALSPFVSFAGPRLCLCAIPLLLPPPLRTVSASLMTAQFPDGLLIRFLTSIARYNLCCHTAMSMPMPCPAMILTHPPIHPHPAVPLARQLYDPYLPLLSLGPVQSESGYGSLFSPVLSDLPHSISRRTGHTPIAFTPSQDVHPLSYPFLVRCR